MNIDSRITDWNLRDQIREGQELRKTLKTPISKRPLSDPEARDSVEASLTGIRGDLGNGAGMKMPVNLDIIENPIPSLC